MAAQLFRRPLHWFRERGFTRSLQSAIGVLDDVLFDRLHGLETSENVYELEDIADDAKPHCQAYQPTRIRHFRKLMRSLNLPPSSVFVDVGCGKGRMLIAAAQLGFRRAVGIEISPSLSEVASRNVEAYRRRSKSKTEFEIICADMMNVALRNDENIFYLFWPFDRPLTELFLAKVHASLKAARRDMWIISNNPHYPELFADGVHFQRHSRFVYGGSTFEIYQNTPH